jgi:hypothetical protein
LFYRHRALASSLSAAAQTAIARVGDRQNSKRDLDRKSEPVPASLPRSIVL